MRSLFQPLLIDLQPILRRAFLHPCFLQEQAHIQTATPHEMTPAIEPSAARIAQKLFAPLCVGFSSLLIPDVDVGVFVELGRVDVDELFVKEGSVAVVEDFNGDVAVDE